VIMEDDQRPAKPVRVITRVLDELGLVSVYRSPTDTKLLCIQRFVRLFAYGGSTLILVSYLSALGISDVKIGLFMTLTLAGDVIISFFLTLVADGLGRKNILALGAALMAASGVIFGITGNYWILLLAAIFGVISPSGNEIGPFRAIEESTLAHLSPAAVRPDIFAWYSLIGNAGTAFGMMTCGWVVHTLQSKKSYDDVRAYRTMFFAYALIGVIKLVLALSLSKKCELEKDPKPREDPERAPLLGNGNGAAADRKPPKPKRSLFPEISRESRIVFINLAILFALDAFASGLAPL
jgi:MFS family permease